MSHQNDWIDVGYGNTYNTSSNNTFTGTFKVEPLALTYEERLENALRHRVFALMDVGSNAIGAVADALWTMSPIREESRLMTYVAERDDEDEGWVVNAIADIGVEFTTVIEMSWSFSDDELYLAEFDWMPGEPINDEV